MALGHQLKPCSFDTQQMKSPHTRLARAHFASKAPSSLARRRADHVRAAVRCVHLGRPEDPERIGSTSLYPLPRCRRHRRQRIPLPAGRSAHLNDGQTPAFIRPPQVLDPGPINARPLLPLVGARSLAFSPRCPARPASGLPTCLLPAGLNLVLLVDAVHWLLVSHSG